MLRAIAATIPKRSVMRPVTAAAAQAQSAMQDAAAAKQQASQAEQKATQAEQKAEEYRKQREEQLQHGLVEPLSKEMRAAYYPERRADGGARTEAHRSFDLLDRDIGLARP